MTGHVRADRQVVGEHASTVVDVEMEVRVEVATDHAPEEITDLLALSGP